MNKTINGTFLSGEKLRYVLLSDLTIYTDIYGERMYFTIPKGFETDFATIPHLFWGVVSPIDEFIRIPALAHDFFYKHTIMTRVDADLIFLEKMRSFGKGMIIKPFIAFCVVRLFGWIYFNKHI
jgi:hypothetical protein